MRTRPALLLASLALTAVLVGCGSITAPDSCPFGSGAADPTAFAAVFSDMSIRTASGASGTPGGESEFLFPKGESLDLTAVGVGSAEAQLCVGERKGGGKIVINSSMTIREGELRFPLGVLPPNPYVARVAVGGQIVRNVTFEIK